MISQCTICCNSIFTAVEWIGKNEGCRNIQLKLSDRKILVQNELDEILRTIDLNFLTVPGRKGQLHSVRVFLATDERQRMINIRIPREYDLVCCTSALVALRYHCLVALRYHCKLLPPQCGTTYLFPTSGYINRYIHEIYKDMLA